MPPRAPPTTPHLRWHTGTAAVVSPIKQFHFEGVDYDVPVDPSKPEAGAGPLAQRVWDELMAIQYGKKEHEWSVLID